MLSCNDSSVDNNKSSEETLQELKAEYLSVGQKHNAILEKMSSKLKEKKNISSRPSLLSTIKSAGSKYYQSLYTSQVKKQKAKESFDHKFDQRIVGMDRRKKAAKINPVDKIMDTDQFNQKQKTLLKEVITVLYNNSDLSVINRKLEAVNQEAAKSLQTKKELEPIIVTTSVAKASAEYWYKNSIEWKNINNKNSQTDIRNNKEPEERSPDAGGVAAADASAAGVTLVTGCGEGALGACTVAAAGVASGITAIYTCWD